MQSTRKLLVAGAITTVVGVSAFAGVASAQSGTSSSNDSLAAKIAQKFNLNKDDVQQVIDQNKSDRQEVRQQKLEDRLSQAVTDGKITSAQKDAIMAKIKDLQSYSDSIKDKTPNERRDLMKAKLDELKQWAKDNNLSQYLPMINRQGHHGMGMMHDSSSSLNNTSSPSN
jgi:hypothetical protein